RKIRQLIADLQKAGFIDRGGKGSHRNFCKGSVRVTVSGKAGDDVKRYQENQVLKAIERSENEEA
ncbi:MAG: type II toxin-antitoxin system HicA family toxin, partial [Akkermansiaceae bacterium]|nr:type II toxin-antitoxin system HicA family toxin [Akkermansiaceae bacterium]MDP4781399.1 type II toxin-antitoxin system HicA family toxin [Akkermansiaceae bacterium]MDP4897648.1 type II toxin-antitoxin system HicA family toxin [Akkermansiaceae bacterium]